MIRAYVYDRDCNERFIMEWEGRLQRYMMKILTYSMRNEMKIFKLKGLFAVIRDENSVRFVITIDSIRGAVNYTR